ARHVLRVRTGDPLTILDGAGRIFESRVEGSDRDKIKLSVTDERRSPEPPCRITLLQALPKGKIIESIIQKATELGVWRIVPLLTERVVMKLGDKEAARKAVKWQAIAVEAIKQSGSAWLPKVEVPCTPAQFLARDEKFELPLIASLEPDSGHPR